MRVIDGKYRATVLRAVGWAIVTVALTFGWALAPRPPAAAASSSSASSAASNPADQKPTPMGVWHHFGESPSAPPAEPRQNSGWRHFGDGGSTPPASPSYARPEQPLSPGREMAQVQPLSRTREMEEEMYALVNRDRADPANMPETQGRALPLRWNERLAEVARAHSLDMLRQGYFGHVDPQGRSVANRVEAAGMQWRAVGENIAIYNGISQAQAAFMNEPRFSKNHRGNILSPDFTDVGIGVVQGPDGSLYITQDFYTAITHSATR